MKDSDMSQSQFKDPSFKLFGRKIPLPDSLIPAKPPSKDSCIEITEVEIECPEDDKSEEPDKQSTTSGHGEDENRTQTRAKEGQVTSMPKQDYEETNGTDEERVFKKPDKIIPCPRCNSLETKFCYFNNYNVNQPRHFCKNCQRYWTAGGTMRNVPIGAGRRKNKLLASQYRQILVSSDGIPITRMENSESTDHPFISPVESVSAVRPSMGNGVVLKFGPEAPLCESMENVLNLGDQKRYAEVTSVSRPTNAEEPSLCGSSVTASSTLGKDLPEIVMQKEQVGLPGSTSEPSMPHPLHCYPVPPLVFPWKNPGWNKGTSIEAAQSSSGQACITNGDNPSRVQWFPAPMLAVPSFVPPTTPLQFVPASYWGCMPLWAPGTGNLQLSRSNGCRSPSSSTSTSCCSGNGSPTLGKHSRDSNFMDEQNADKFILAPKTMRIDDSNGASKSPL